MNNNSDLSMPIDIIYSELATIWLKVKQKQLKQSSISDYEFILKNYILNTFGKIPAQEIDENAIQEQIEEWATTNSLSGKQISYSTMKLIKTVLKGSLYFYRTETKQIPLNFSMIRIPKTRKVEISIFTKGQQKKLIKYIFCNLKPNNAGIALGLLAGMRIGEICALQWKDIDLANRVIYINNTLQRISISNPESGKKSKIVISSPKTSMSNRRIPITTTLMNILETIMPNRDSINNWGEYYVVSGKIKPTEPRALRMFYSRVLNNLDIPYLKFHSLRHTFATTAKNCGMAIEVLSRILGHESVETTMNLYLHPNIDDIRKAMLDFENNWF